MRIKQNRLRRVSALTGGTAAVSNAVARRTRPPEAERRIEAPKIGHATLTSCLGGIRLTVRFVREGVVASRRPCRSTASNLAGCTGKSPTRFAV